MSSATEVIFRDEEAVRVFNWRMEWLTRAGWSTKNAATIADSDIDYKYANRVLADCKRVGKNQTFALSLILST